MICRTVLSTAALSLFLSSVMMQGEQAPAQQIVGPNDLLERVKTIVPSDWSVTQDQNLIFVSRDRQVKRVNLINAESRFPEMESEEDYMLRHSVDTEFQIIIDLQDKLTPLQVKSMQQENDKTWAEMQRLQERMQHMKAKGHFFSRGRSGDQELLDQYEQLEKTLHRIPDYCEENFSVGITSNVRVGETIYPEEVDAECNKVLSEIRSLFKRPCIDW